MGRINLTPLRVRKRALANLETRRTQVRPNWLDVVGDIPPPQILIRHQPQQQPLVRVRTKSLLDPETNLPTGKTQQYTQEGSISEYKRRIPNARPSSHKASKLFTPFKIRYEEDMLRKQFFSDHPWELARPRVVLETNGRQHAHTDWSTGLVQPGIPLSGESVVQRQLWLLANIPDMTITESYEIARKEFYTLRRQEEIRNRIAKEEAETTGATFGKSVLQRSMQIENKMHDDWQKWAADQSMEMQQRLGGFAGTQLPQENAAMEATTQYEKQKVAGGQPGSNASPRIGAGVFNNETKRQDQFQRGGNMI